MSQANLQLVQRAYDRMSEGELALDLVAPEFEFDVSEVMPDMAGTHGRESAERLFRDYADVFEDFEVRLHELLFVDGEHVVTEVLDGGRLKNSGDEVHNRFFHVWTLRDGKIVRWSSHMNRDRALRAAGAGK